MNNYHEINIIQEPIASDTWKSLLFAPLPKRNFYEQTNNTLQFSQIAGRILGTDYDEVEYFLNLHELYNNDKIHVLSESLDKYIPPERFQAIQRVLTINQNENGLSVNRFVAFLDGEQLLPSHHVSVLQRHIRKSLMTVLETFKHKHSKGFNDPSFRRILVDLIKWSSNHLKIWLDEIALETEFPHVIWYGDATKSQLYFLYYLMIIGCDVLLFHPEGKDLFKEIDENNEFTQVITNPSTVKLQSFPVEKPARQSTVAYRATQEMNSVLHHEGSSLYKPWQFRNYLPYAVTLKTTYDELFLIAKEKAFIRPNFKANNEIVEIPSLFAKVMGVSKNNKEYWDRLQDLTEYKNTKLILNFPFTKEIDANYQFHFQQSLNKEGKLDPKKMKKANWWKYSHLPDGTQNGIAYVISRMCEHPKLLSFSGESLYDVQLYLFTQVANIPDKFLNLIQVFDYAQEVPKVVLYNTEINGNLSRSDAALLIFLNEFGLDIILYNPPGHSCIEKYIDADTFDTHWLEEMSFEQEFKEPSIFRKIFNSITF